MPWIKEELHHETFMDEFWQLILRRFDTGGMKWWPDMNAAAEKIDIYKICYTEGLLVYNENGDHVPPKQDENGSICITHHSIMRRHDGEFLGMAQSTGAIEVKSSMFATDPQDLLEQLKGLFKSSLDFTKLYVYMLEDYKHFTHFEGVDGAEALTIITEDHGFGVFNSSMDVEFHTDEHYEREMYQSPYVMINFIGGEVSKIGSIGKLDFATDTNWWADSKIVVQGYVDHKSMSLVMQADTVPYWEENKTPQIPLFYGNLMREGEYQEQVALFAGSAISNPHHDFDNTELDIEVVQPVTRNYVFHPSNGVDNVMLKRSKQGGRYQAHYLSWNAPPNQTPPLRQHLEADVIKEEQVELLLKEMTIQDRTTEDITETTELIYFEPFGIADDTDVLAYHSHLLIGRTEIAEIIEYSKKEWWVRVKRIARSPKSYPMHTELIGITPHAIRLFTKKYPRAWNQLEGSTTMSYQFNPSRYSGNVQSSYAYVVHPEAGKVGYLPNVVVAPAISITNNTVLEVNVHCEECDQDDYNPDVPEMEALPRWNPLPNSILLGLDVTVGGNDGASEIPEGKLPDVGGGDETPTDPETDPPTPPVDDKDKTLYLGQVVDEDGDGKPDGWDYNNDGKADILDTNNDGTINTDDIPIADGKVNIPSDWEYIKNVGKEGWDVDGDGKVDIADRDEDGELSPDEFDRAMGDAKEQKILDAAERHDTDGDGELDAWDVDGDGKPDTWDRDKDNQPDAWDTNGDGQPDAWDTDLDGKQDVFDTNGDGDVDAWDTNNDGEDRPDAWDTDGDSVPDVFDKDNDGKPDNLATSPKSYLMHLCDYSTAGSNFELSLNNTLLLKGQAESLVSSEPDYLNQSYLSNEFLYTHHLFNIDDQASQVVLTLKDMYSLNNLGIGVSADNRPDVLNGFISIEVKTDGDSSRETVALIHWVTQTEQNDDGTFRVVKFTDVDIETRRDDLILNVTVPSSGHNFILTITPSATN